MYKSKTGKVIELNQELLENAISVASLSTALLIEENIRNKNENLIKKVIQGEEITKAEQIRLQIIEEICIDIDMEIQNQWDYKREQESIF